MPCAPRRAHINYSYAFGRRHPLAAQICPEQIWTSAGRPQGVRQAHLKSCAIFASIGEICGLATGITFAQLCYTCVADIGQQFVSPAQARNLYVGGQFQ